MNDRWVCKRCYADNDGAATACVRCGLERGADISAQPAEGWPAQTAAWTPAWRGLLRYAWVAVFGIVLVVGFFASREQEALENVAVGDCFNTEEGESISGIDAKECDEPHTYEVFHITDWPSADDSYPSVDAQEAFVFNECAPAFEQYVGAELTPSSLDFIYLSPTEEGWSEGDHEFICAAYDPSEEPLERSVRDSGL
jgi:hypothetical protein